MVRAIPRETAGVTGPTQVDRAAVESTVDRAAFLELNALPWTGALVLALLSAVGGVLIGVTLLTHGRVRPAFAGLALGPFALAVTGFAWWAPRLFGAGPSAPAIVGVLLVAPMLLWIPAVLHAILAAVAGAARGPRRVRVAALVVALALAALVAPLIAAGGDVGLTPFAVARLLAGLPLALLLFPASMQGGADETAAPEAGASAALAFAAFVGLAEAGMNGVLGFFLMPAVARAADPEARWIIVEALRASHYAPSVLGAWVAVGLSTAAAAVALFAAARARGPGMLVGAGWLLVGPLAVGLSPVPEASWRAWIAEAPVVPAPAPGSDDAAPEGSDGR
jgi:hypothetical protein